MNRWHVDSWKRAAAIFLALLLLGRFLVVTWGQLLANFNSNEGDQGAYLTLGLAIRDGQALTDGNRHPLLPLLIAPFAQREWSYFTLAKLVSLASSVLALLATFLVGWRLYDEWTGLLAVMLLTINQEFLFHAPRVLCEALLVLTFLSAWYASVRALEHLSSIRRGFMAGALTGLAYLTKGTSSILVLCFVVSALFLYQRRTLQNHGLWAFLGGYLLLTSPLLIYNTVQYQNPLYSFSITHAMWLDRWDDRYVSQSGLPTALSYLRTHSMREIIKRQRHGMVTILPAMGQALLPGSYEGLVSWLQVGWVWVAMGFELLLLSSLRYSATIAAHVRELLPRVLRRPRVLMTGLIVVLSYLLFAWYAPVSDEPRFYLPLAPILYLSVTGVGTSLAQQDRHGSSLLSRRMWMAGITTGALVSGWAMVSSAQALQWSNPFTHDRRANIDVDHVVGWLNDRAQDDLRILWGPSHTLPKWKFLPQVTYKAIPSDLRSWEELERFISQQGFHYIVLDQQMVKWRVRILGRYLDQYGSRILFREIPPHWTLAFAQEGGIASPEWEGYDWYVIELTPPGTGLFDPMGPVRLGSSIRLVGYRVERATLQPGDPLELTLAWSAEERPIHDYSVSVHLLDRKGRRGGEEDRSPLAGTYPTSRWQKGIQIIDRRRFPVDPRALPGEYRIMVSMYHPDTSTRLPAATAEGQPLSDGQIPLPVRVRVGSAHSFAVPSATKRSSTREQAWTG